MPQGDLRQQGNHTSSPNALNSAPPPFNPQYRKSDHRRNPERQDRNREGRDLCTPRPTPDNGKEAVAYKVLDLEKLSCLKKVFKNV